MKMTFRQVSALLSDEDPNDPHAGGVEIRSAADWAAMLEDES